MIEIAAKTLDVLVGLVTILVIRSRWKEPKNSMTMKDLLKEIESRDKKIERLEIEIRAWKKHHEHLTNTRHLHSS